MFTPCELVRYTQKPSELLKVVQLSKDGVRRLEGVCGIVNVKM